MKLLTALGLTAALLLAACGGSAASTPVSGGSIEAPQPTPALEPVTTFEAISIKGKGAKVPRITKPIGVAALVTLKYAGRDNFVVWAIAQDGSRSNLLVNTIGRYQGTVLLDETGHSVALSVDTTGSWTGTIAPLSQADRWSGTDITTGSGDNVLMLSSETIGLKTMLIESRGNGNFVVWAYSVDGQRDLLVNTIGDYSGEVLLPDQTYIIAIQSESNWGISPPY